MTPIKGVSIGYYDPTTGVYFEGEAEFDIPWVEEKKMPESPARISLPGQPGFQSEQPLFDCGALSMATPLAPKEG